MFKWVDRDQRILCLQYIEEILIEVVNGLKVWLEQSPHWVFGGQIGSHNNVKYGYVAAIGYIGSRTPTLLGKGFAHHILKKISQSSNLISLEEAPISNALFNLAEDFLLYTSKVYH